MDIEKIIRELDAYKNGRRSLEIMIKSVLEAAQSMQDRLTAAESEVKHLVKLKDEILDRESNLIKERDQYKQQLEETQRQEPVVKAYISLEYDGPCIDVEVLNGVLLQPEMSPVNLYASPIIPQRTKEDKARSAQAKDETVNELGEPEAIYLQLHDPEYEGPSDSSDYKADGVTWCWHRINDNDVRYIRQDLAQSVEISGESDDALIQRLKDIWWRSGCAHSMKATIAKEIIAAVRASPNKADVPANVREFLEYCAAQHGYMITGNRLAIEAQKIIDSLLPLEDE